MGTIFREDGYVGQILSGDHQPPHVHVSKAGGKAKILIGDENTAPSVMRVAGMSDREVKAAVGLVGKYQEDLLAGWRRIHG